MLLVGYDNENREKAEIYTSIEKFIKEHNLANVSKVFGSQDPKKVAECYAALYIVKEEEFLKSAIDYNQLALQQLQSV